MPAESGRTLERLELPLIILIAAVTVIVARPYGDFPLNDDAHYAVAAWDFAKTGQFHLTIATVPSLRAQVVWGALFTRLFGESFEVLRASTMTLGLITLLLVNRLLALLPISSSLRIVATMALLFHPIFFLSSFTFMTEVPFVFASAAAMYFYVLGIRDERVGLILLGGVAAAVSWWIRQTGILNAIAPLAALVVFRQHIAARYKRLTITAAVPVVLFAAIFFMRPDWLSGSQREFRLHYKMWSEATFRLPQQVALIFHYCFFNATNNALFFLPLSIAIAWRQFRPAAARVVATVAVIVFLGGMTQLVALGHPMPYTPRDNCCDIIPGQLVVDFGFGPITVSDRFGYPFAMPYAWRLIVSYGAALLAAATAAAIFIRCIDGVREPKANPLFIVATIHAILGTIALWASVQYYDRYSLDATWSLVLLIPLVVRWDVRSFRVLSVAMMIVIAAFSIFATNEYFAWNRARWDAFAYYKAHGGDMKEINAGLEPFVLYELSQITDYRERRRHFGGPGSDRPYLVAFHQQPGYRVIRTFPFSGWGGLHQASLALQEKVDRAH